MQFVREIVFSMDIYQLLNRCQSVVFNMDGRVPDDGSVVEAAAAFASGRPIVIWKTTPITMLGGTDNPMVSGLAMNWQTVSELTALPAAIAAAVAATSAARRRRVHPGATRPGGDRPRRAGVERDARDPQRRRDQRPAEADRGG